MRQFTIAFAENDDPAILLHPKEDLETLSPEILELIQELRDRKIFSGDVLVYNNEPIDSEKSDRWRWRRGISNFTSPFTIITQNTKYVMHAMQMCGKKSWICHEDDTIDEVNARVLQCSLPEKFILGCSGCTQNTYPQCPRISIDATDPDIEDILTLFKHNKTVLGKYTYISPAMTKNSPFACTRRTMTEHSFDTVEQNTEQRQRASDTRKKRSHMKKVLCPNCYVNGACKKYLCDKIYAGNVDEILEKYEEVIPRNFSPKELAHLLHLWGVIPTKVNKRTYVGSLTLPQYREGPFSFSLIRLTTGSPEITLGDTYKKVIDQLESLGVDTTLPKNLKPLTKEQTAILYNMCSYSYLSGYLAQSSQPAGGVSIGPTLDGTPELRCHAISPKAWWRHEHHHIYREVIRATKLRDIYAHFQRFTGV